MHKIPQKVDSDCFLCYNIGIRKGGNCSYFDRKINIIFSNLYFRFFNFFNMTSSALGTDYFGKFYFSWKETIKWTESSESTLRRSIKDGAFPKPVQLFKRRVGFRKSDLILWAEGKRNWK